MIGFSQCADHPSCRWQGTGVQVGGDGAVERKGSSRSAVAVVDGSLKEREPPGRSNLQEEVKDRSRKGSWGPGQQGEFPGFRSADPRTQRGGLGPHLPVVAAGTKASREPRSHLCTLTLSPRPRGGRLQFRPIHLSALPFFFQIQGFFFRSIFIILLLFPSQAETDTRTGLLSTPPRESEVTEGGAPPPGPATKPQSRSESVFYSQPSW